ncbi:MAG: starch-binding protein [Bacilli bacterium]|nr:starch-binding protein [Bacilli bacterium]
MKKKSIILLSSILAGSLLVGGAFAAWAVTDNADPLGINVTPGTITPDDTQYVNLEWGSSTQLTDLGEITPGTNRRAGVVYLKSSDTDYTGKLNVSFKDDSSEAVIEAKTGNANVYLRDYLNVYVYAGDVELTELGALPEGTTKATILKSTAAVDGVKSATVVSAGSTEGIPYTIFVSLDTTASAVLDYIKNDNVALTVDWAPASEKDLATDRVVYASKQDGWSGMYVYAWNTSTGVNNGAFPGVEMVQYNDNVYRLAIPASANAVIFSAGDNNDAHKTADLSLTGYSTTNQYWNGTAWAQVPAVKNYYLVGKIGESTTWTTPNTYKFTINPENPAEYVLKDVVLKKDNELKVAYFDGTSTVADNDYIPGPTSGESNLVIPADGTYDFYFSATENESWKTGETYENAFGYAKHLWVVPQ